MNVRKIIEKRIRQHVEGVDMAGDVNAAISANVNERGQSSRVSSRQTVVARDGRTTVHAEKTTEGGDAQDVPPRA